jgi:surface protein
MNFMFYNASQFNQNISAWNVASVTPKPPSTFSNGSQLTAQTSPFGVAFTAPIISNSGIVTYSGNTASMTYTVAAGVTQVQVRKASDNAVIAATTFVSGTSASVSSVTITENMSIVVVALGNAAGRESAASAPQTLLKQFAAPVKASEPVYTTVSAGSYTASMTYTVAAGVSAVQVRKASDNTPISGATSSISSLTATITVPFTNTISMVIVALTNNDIGRESLPSVAQTLVGQYAAPTLSGSVTYSDNTASMTYSVNSGVTAVTVLKSDLTALPTDVLVHTIINAGSSGRTVSVSVVFATSMSIVVIAQGNATGNQSAASAPLALLANFVKPMLSLPGITYSDNTAIMTYNVAEGVSAVSVLQPNLSALPSDATVTTNTLSGTTATLHISLSGSRGSLSFVVVALTNPNGRQSNASDTQFISTGISDITFTKNQSSNLWYFGFNCSNPSSVSGLNIHMTWTDRHPVNGAIGLTNNYSSATIANGANSLLISDPNNWLNSFLTGKPANVSIDYVSVVAKNIATSFIPIPLTGGPYTMSVSDVNANAHTCTLVIPAALDQQRAYQNRTWIYFHYFIDATTNVTVNIPNPNGLYYISGSLQSSIINVQVPPSLWGKPLRNALYIVNDGGNSTGDYVVQQRFTSNDIYTLPNPAALFPVETNEIITYGMSWQTTGEINDVRMWRVSWTIRPTALDVASPNYVSKVGIRIKLGGESTYRFTGVYNYADGAGYAMLHTNVYTNQGQTLGTWITEIRAENADGTITTNYVVRSDYYGAHYVSYGNYVNLTQLASVANGYTLLYGDNVTNLF